MFFISRPRLIKLYFILVLIKQCPLENIAEFANKVIVRGHLPEYLDMFVGMVEMGIESDCQVPAIENQIAKYFTSREFKEHMLLWCSSPDSLSYKQRSDAMNKYTDTVNNRSFHMLRVRTAHISVSSSIHDQSNDVLNDLVCNDIDNSDFSVELKYHAKLLTVLAGIHLG